MVPMESAARIFLIFLKSTKPQQILTTHTACLLARKTKVRIPGSRRQRRHNHGLDHKPAAVVASLALSLDRPVKNTCGECPAIMAIN
jgi:hypothetical protein